MDGRVEKVDLDLVEALGFDPKELGARRMRQLAAIEAVVERASERRMEARRTLEEDLLSIRRVAQEAGMSRTTIHSSPILMGYLKARRESVIPDNRAAQTEEAEALAEAKRTIEALHRRDGEIEILRLKIAELERQNEVLRKHAYAEKEGAPNFSVSKASNVFQLESMDRRQKRQGPQA